MMNNPINNPMLQLVSMMRSGHNPNALLGMLAQNNPQARQFMQMIDGKTSDQLKQMAKNMAAERGTTIEDVARQLGIQIPSER